MPLTEGGEMEVIMYDYLIVGSRLYGSIFGREAINKGYKVIFLYSVMVGYSQIKSLKNRNVLLNHNFSIMR